MGAGLLTALLLGACGTGGATSEVTTDDGRPLGTADAANGKCESAERVGTFEVVLADGYTTVQGQVADGVDPSRVPVELASEGGCRLVQPPRYQCEPRCDVGFTCGPDGACMPLPANVGVGTVTVAGLSAAVQMTAGPPVYYYTMRGELPHPAVEPGATISLQADGAEAPGFSLQAKGIEPLSVAIESVSVEAGSVSEVRWAPASVPGHSSIEISVHLSNHGGTPAWIACTTDDDGSFEVPADLVTRLLDLGYSGFPTVSVTRYTADTADTETGCVELLVRSTVELGVAIPGLISCNRDEDCPSGSICRSDLTCEQTRPADDGG
ncbi:MAG: hypothetical protein ACK2T6_04920 [Anaerolineae bacterium]